MRKIILLSAVMLMFLTGCTSADSEIILSDNAATKAYEESEPAEAVNPEEVIEEPAEDVVVYVCGAVANPGVYELPPGSRIDDAVSAAGGFTEAADRTYVNLAARVDDGFKLLIPTMEETNDEEVVKGIDSFDTASSETGDKGGSGGLVNINTASKEQLVTLPGIGDGIAGKIIKYRDENGSFKKIEDIMKVSGIKEKLFSKIKDHITV